MALRTSNFEPLKLKVKDEFQILLCIILATAFLGMPQEILRNCNVWKNFNPNGN
jgi:hypothetical protein